MNHHWIIGVLYSKDHQKSSRREVHAAHPLLCHPEKAQTLLSRKVRVCNVLFPAEQSSVVLSILQVDFLSGILHNVFLRKFVPTIASGLIIKSF